MSWSHHDPACRLRPCNLAVLTGVFGYFSGTTEGRRGFSLGSCTPDYGCRDRDPADRIALPVASPSAKAGAPAANAVPPIACKDEAGLAMLASPTAPWKGAALRVVIAAEKPLDGELSLIAPDGKVAVTSRDRHGGPPYFWTAEIASPAPGTWQAKLTRDGAASPECASVTRDIIVQPKQPPGPRAGKGVWPVTADLESRHREFVFRLDREIVRRAARRAAVVEGDARGVARSVAQPAVQPFRSTRGREGAYRSARLRRRSLLPARLFRLQDGAAVRLFEMQSRRWRPGAEMSAVVEHRERGAAAGARPQQTSDRLHTACSACSPAREQAPPRR